MIKYMRSAEEENGKAMDYKIPNSVGVSLPTQMQNQYTYGTMVIDSKYLCMYHWLGCSTRETTFDLATDCWHLVQYFQDTKVLPVIMLVDSRHIPFNIDLSPLVRALTQFCILPQIPSHFTITLNASFQAQRIPFQFTLSFEPFIHQALQLCPQILSIKKTISNHSLPHQIPIANHRKYTQDQSNQKKTVSLYNQQMFSLPIEQNQYQLHQINDFSVKENDTSRSQLQIIQCIKVYPKDQKQFTVFKQPLKQKKQKQIMKQQQIFKNKVIKNSQLYRIRKQMNQMSPRQQIKDKSIEDDQKMMEDEIDKIIQEIRRKPYNSSKYCESNSQKNDENLLRTNIQNKDKLQILKGVQKSIPFVPLPPQNTFPFFNSQTKTRINSSYRNNSYQKNNLQHELYPTNSHLNNTVQDNYNQIQNKIKLNNTVKGDYANRTAAERQNNFIPCVNKQKECMEMKIHEASSRQLPQSQVYTLTVFMQKEQCCSATGSLHGQSIMFNTTANVSLPCNSIRFQLTTTNQSFKGLFDIKRLLLINPPKGIFTVQLVEAVPLNINPLLIDCRKVKLANIFHLRIQLQIKAALKPTLTQVYVKIAKIALNGYVSCKYKIPMNKEYISFQGTDQINVFAHDTSTPHTLIFQFWGTSLLGISQISLDSIPLSPLSTHPLCIIKQMRNIFTILDQTVIGNYHLELHYGTIQQVQTLINAALSAKHTPSHANNKSNTKHTPHSKTHITLKENTLLHQNGIPILCPVSKVHQYSLLQQQQQSQDQQQHQQFQKTNSISKIHIKNQCKTKHLQNINKEKQANNQNIKSQKQAKLQRIKLQEKKKQFKIKQQQRQYEQQSISLIANKYNFQQPKQVKFKSLSNCWLQEIIQLLSPLKNSSSLDKLRAQCHPHLLYNFIEKDKLCSILQKMFIRNPLKVIQFLHPKSDMVNVTMLYEIISCLIESDNIDEKHISEYALGQYSLQVYYGQNCKAPLLTDEHEYAQMKKQFEGMHYKLTLREYNSIRTYFGKNKNYEAGRSALVNKSKQQQRHRQTQIVAEQEVIKKLYAKSWDEEDDFIISHMNCGNVTHSIDCQVEKEFIRNNDGPLHILFPPEQPICQSKKQSLSRHQETYSKPLLQTVIQHKPISSLQKTPNIQHNTSPTFVNHDMTHSFLPPPPSLHCSRKYLFKIQGWNECIQSAQCHLQTKLNCSQILVTVGTTIELRFKDHSNRKELQKMFQLPLQQQFDGVVQLINQQNIVAKCVFSVIPQIKSVYPLKSTKDNGFCGLIHILIN